MRKFDNGEWNAQAEIAMMGTAIAIDSEDQLRYIVEYALNTLRPVYSGDLPEDLTPRVDEIVDNATTKYNSSKDKSIKYFVVNSSPFGVLLTFVRDKKNPTKKDGSPVASGTLAWVENLDAPDCSELGCVFFSSQSGLLRRIS